MGKHFFKLGTAFLGAVVFFLVSVSAVSAYVSPGTPTGYVNDYAGVLTAPEKAELEKKLSDFEKTSAVQIAVVTVKNLSGDYIENFAEKLFAEWGIGDKEKDSGVLLLIAVEDRELRIEVGYGLEGTFTDGQAGSIIRNDITPSFKDGNYFAGISKGVESIMQATKGEYVGTGLEGSEALLGLGSVPVLWFLVIMIFQGFAALLGRSKSWWLGGVLGASAGAIITYFKVANIPFEVGVVLTVVLTVFGLIFDALASINYARNKERGISRPWWHIGGGRGSSGGGGSFGGFGGGSSGGGGASGRW